jgi:hypothetical protein
VVPWETKRYKAQEGQIKLVEESMETLYKYHLTRLFDEEVLAKIRDLELQKNKLLLDKEKDWCIKNIST